MFGRLVGFGLVVTLACFNGSIADSRPTPKAQTVRSWLLQYHAGRDLRGFSTAEASYAAAYVDLNGDGRDEAVVYFESRGSCGSGGCRLYILTSRRGFWHRVSGHTIIRRPIRVLRTRHHGWRDISVNVRGDVFEENYHAALPFDGSTYPLNSTIPPAWRLPRNAQARVLIGRNTPLAPLRP